MASGKADGRDNREGFVLRFTDGTRVKVKHDEYVRLHRLVTGVSSRTIWEWLRDGRPLDTLLDAVPDEFYRWVQGCVAELTDAYERREATHRRAAYELLTGLVGDEQARFVLEDGDRCRDREMMYRGLLEEWRTELSTFASGGFDANTIGSRVEAFEQTKDPQRKQAKFEALLEVITDVQQLGYLSGLARKIADNDVKMADRMAAERAEVDEVLAPVRGDIAERMRTTPDGIDRKLLMAVVSGLAYDRLIWAAIRPDHQAPFADREAA